MYTQVILPAPEWFKERALGRISLGSLMTLMLLRTVTNNFSTSARWVGACLLSPLNLSQFVFGVHVAAHSDQHLQHVCWVSGRESRALLRSRQW